MKKIILFLFALCAVSIHAQTLTTAKAKWTVIKTETAKGANTAARVGLAGEDIVNGVRDTLSGFAKTSSLSGYVSKTAQDTITAIKRIFATSPDYSSLHVKANGVQYALEAQNTGGGGAASFYNSADFPTLRINNLGGYDALQVAGGKAVFGGEVRVIGTLKLGALSQDTAASQAYARSLNSDFVTKSTIQTITASKTISTNSNTTPSIQVNQSGTAAAIQTLGGIGVVNGKIVNITTSPLNDPTRSGFESTGYFIHAGDTLRGQNANKSLFISKTIADTATARKSIIASKTTTLLQISNQNIGLNANAANFVSNSTGTATITASNTAGGQSINADGNVFVNGKTESTTFQTDTTNTSAVTKGQIGWNADDNTAVIGQGTGITLNVGEESLVGVRNSSGHLIPSLKAIYQTGQTGLRPTVDTASVVSVAKMKTLAITTASIANNTNSKATTQGIVRDENTSGLTAGKTIYLGTQGGLTNDTTQKYIVELGTTLVSHNTQGAILAGVKSPLYNDTTLAIKYATIAPSSRAVKTYVDNEINSNIAYGCIFVSDSETAQSIPAGLTYTKITAFNQLGLSYNLTTAADSITATKAGVYNINCNASIASGTANINSLGAVFVNGVEQENIHFERKIGTASDVGSVSISGLVHLNVGDDVSFRMRHENGTAVNITVHYANLNMRLVKAD